MRSLTGLSVVVLVGLLFLVGTGTGAVATSNAFAEVGDEDFEPDAIVLDISLADDGTAEWTIEHRYRLADESDEMAFGDLENDIRENESAYLDRFNQRMEPTLDAAIAATGREMAITDVAIETETRALPQEYGIVRYTFTWQEFSSVENDELYAGDAIAGLFLDDDSVLRMSWSDRYDLADVSPAPSDEDDRSVIWRGPTEFDRDEPRLLLHHTTESQIVDDSGWWLLPAGIFVVFLVLLAGWLYRDRYHTDGTDSAIPTTEADELLSNEERVLRLLADEGGRMKQQEIVTALDWTDAKTSQVISDMRESGQVESFRLGRENVVSLADDASEND